MALVIGNDAYQQVPKLRKAVNDARAVSDTLKDIGFEVIRAENVARRPMNRLIDSFTSRLEPGDVALFFFAGHGVEIDSRNFLLPTDIPQGGPGQEEFVKSEALPVDRILAGLRQRGTRVSLVILDACRDNPFQRKGTRSLGGTRGLARIAPPEGTFILYSAGEGQTALDRIGDTDPHPNSVFTRSLVPLLKEPGLKLTDAARRLRRQVQKLARSVSHTQRPAYYDEVTGDFFFVRGAGRGGPTPPVARSQDDVLWAGIEASKVAADFEFYLRQFPKGKFAALAKLKLERLQRAKPDPAVSPPREQTPVREASDLRGIWTCSGTASTRCARMTCTTSAVVKERLGKTRFAGRTKVSCRTRAKKGCRLPRSVKRQQTAEGAVSAKVKGSRVQVTFVAEKPNADMSSISEYELKGDILTYRRDLQGESSNYRETCKWSAIEGVPPVARQ